MIFKIRKMLELQTFLQTPDVMNNYWLSKKIM